MNTNSDIDDNIDYDKKSENEPIIYHLINNKGDIYLYTIKSKTNNCIYLRCKDRKCLGKAVFKNNTLTVTEECNIKYDKHNYIQLKNPSDKIKSNNVTKEEMKLHLYQKAYFLYHYQNFPNLIYDDISLNLIKDYECDIIYSPKQFNNYKQLFYKNKKQELTTDKILEYIDYYDENLLKVDYKFLNNENKFDNIKIYGTYISLNLLNDKKINQYFIDGTYKVVPYNKDYKCMVVLIGFNYSLNLYQLILVALLSNETGEILYKIL